jgi:cytochrome c-type biogenesis protein CcmH
MNRLTGWPVLALAILAIAAALLMGWRRPPSSIADRTMQIAAVLRCPVCHAQSVADSQAPAAVQMRTDIEHQLTLGRSAQQIERSFVAQYGSDVLMTPPEHGFGLVVWIGPLIALAVGAWFASRGFARRQPGTALGP